MFDLATLEQLHTHLNKKRYRSLIILKGELTWAEQVFEQYSSFIEQLNIDSSQRVRCKIYSDVQQASGNINRTNYVHHLGTENQSILFIDPKLNVDAFAALSGTIIAGGICFLWRGVDDNDWANENHLFGQRLAYYHNDTPWHFLMQESSIEDFNCKINDFIRGSLIEAISSATIKKTEVKETESGSSLYDLNKVPTAVFTEQQQFIEQLVAHLNNNTNCPCVLTADRGRGKSAALAIACAHLLANQNTGIKIVVTAPNRAALGVFYQHLELTINQLLSVDKPIKIKSGGCAAFDNHLVFLPVDQALLHCDKKAILLVDEAAGIPVYLLKRLLDGYKQSVFSSTVHGYEGAGKGFTIKFLSYLNSRYKHYLLRHLQQPIRWQNGDPLEKLLFDVCLLNAELPESPKLHSLQNDMQYTMVAISQVELAANEILLHQIFSILVTAHYQTKPSDLKMILEHPSVQLFISCVNDKVLAVALTINEGKLEQEMISAINKGKRRIKSHFLPQSILTQCVDERAFNYSYLRVMRIAVHPEWQQQGIGQQLLSFVEQWAITQSIDILGTSFAASLDVSHFWFKVRYFPVRMGFNADASSGEHSMMMLKGLNEQSKIYVDSLVKQFYYSFDYLLVDEYKSISVELVQLILSHQVTTGLDCGNTYNLSDKDVKHITAYSQGHVQYSCVVQSLHRWLLMYLSVESHSSLQKRQSISPLIARILMKHSIKDVCVRYKIDGKKALNHYIMSLVSDSLSANSAN